MGWQRGLMHWFAKPADKSTGVQISHPSLLRRSILDVLRDREIGEAKDDDP